MFKNKSSAVNVASTSMIEFILDQTETYARRLPIDTIHALQSQIGDIRVLEILLNAAKNKQILNYDLMNKLIAEFDPQSSSDVNRMLVNIFANVCKNNQSLSAKLLAKLQQTIENDKDEEIVRQALAIFVQRGQRGEKLTHEVIEQILSRIILAGKNDLITKQEYMSALASIIQTNHQDACLNMSLSKSKLKDILLVEVASENVNIQKYAISACTVFTTLKCRPPMNDRVASELLTKLVEVATSLTCEVSARENIYSLLKKWRHLTDETVVTDQMIDAVEMANLKFDNLKNEELQLLNELDNRVSRGTPLLQVNYNQLAEIIDQLGNNDDTQLKALDVLLKNQDNQRWVFENFYLKFDSIYWLFKLF